MNSNEDYLTTMYSRNYDSYFKKCLCRNQCYNLSVVLLIWALFRHDFESRNPVRAFR